MGETKNINSKGLTAQELKEQAMRERFEAAANAMRKLIDVTKNTRKSIATFDKSQLRSFLQNIGSNEKNLRNLSWYLYYRSQTYMRLVNFYANMFCLYARSVIPPYDLTKEPDVKKTLKSYNETLDYIEKMHLQQEFLTIYLICFIQDVFYGIYLKDDTGTVIYPVPADYAKITGKYATGDFSYAIDMTYFRSRQELLEYIPEPFQSMWNEYQNTNQKWVSVPDEYCICLKYRAEDIETVLAPLVAAFNALINLSDLEDIQAIADEQEIYKMIWYEMETIQGSKEVDDWKIDPNLMIDYYNKMLDEAVPDYVTAAIVPGKLNTISFDTDKTNDVSKISKATESVLNTAGGAEVLNGATISGAEAVRSAQIANTEYAISTLLPQTEAVVNRLLSYEVKNPSKVKFFPVSVYTKAKFKDDLLKAAEYGMPTKLAYMAMDGFSEKDTMSLNFLEESVLKLGEKLIPVQSTHTQSGDNVRTPSDEQSTSAEESAEKRDKAKG